MLLRRIARPLFASWFVTEGLDALRHPASHADDARSAVDLIAGLVPAGAYGDAVARCHEATSRQAVTLVQVHGAATLTAGVLLAIGKTPRLAALVLAGLTAPLIIANLPFRDRPGVDADERRERRERFVRALAFTGGAMLAGADYEGRPGVVWRVGKARRDHTTASH